MVVVVLVGGEERQVVPWVAVDGVQVGQGVPQPQGDRVRAQEQRGDRLGDGVGEEELQGMHVARGCKISLVTRDIHSFHFSIKSTVCYDSLRSAD